MKIIYIFDCAINEIKYWNMSTLLLFCFVLFWFFAAKSYWFLFKSSISWHFFILAILDAIIHVNFIFCHNWLTVTLLYSSSIKLFSGTSVSLWFAGSSLKHALICFFCVSVMPSSQWTAFLLLYVLLSLLQSFMASCLCSRRRTSRAAPSRETLLNVTLWC